MIYHLKMIQNYWIIKQFNFAFVNILNDAFIVLRLQKVKNVQNKTIMENRWHNIKSACVCQFKLEFYVLCTLKWCRHSIVRSGCAYIHLLLFEIRNVLPSRIKNSNKISLNNNTKYDDLFSVHRLWYYLYI